MKKSRKIVLSLLLLAALSYVARGVYRSGHYVSTDDATVESQVVNLAPRVSGVVEKVLVSEHQLVRRGQLLLMLEAQDYRTAAQQARAHLATLDQSARSQNLKVRWSQQQLQSDLEQSRARIAAAQARVQEAVEAETASAHQIESSELTSQQTNLGVETARRSWAAALESSRAEKAQAERAQLDWQRYQKLYAQEAISKQQLDQARADWLSQTNRALAQEQQAAALGNQIQVQRTSYRGGLEDTVVRRQNREQARAVVQRSQAEVAQALAQLHEAENGRTQIALEKQFLREIEARRSEAKEQLNQAELNLGYTKIYAPWDGVVGQRPSEVGAYLKAGQVGLQLVSATPWVVANFKETQLARLQAGQRASIWVDFNSGHKLEAHVDSLQPATGSRFSLIPPENASGNWVKVVQRIPVKLVLEHPSPNLLPGMSATVEVEIR